MRLLAQLLSPNWQIGRSRFVGLFAAAGLVYVTATNGLLALLPWIADFSQPLGVNAGLLLNGLWSAAGFACGWVVLAGSAARLRDAGWPVVLAFAPLPGLLLAGVWALPLIGPELVARAIGAIGTRSISYALGVLFAVPAIGVLTACMLLPARKSPSC